MKVSGSFREVFGVTAVRGMEVFEILDEAGNVCEVRWGAAYYFILTLIRIILLLLFYY